MSERYDKLGSTGPQLLGTSWTQLYLWEWFSWTLNLALFGRYWVGKVCQHLFLSHPPSLFFGIWFWYWWGHFVGELDTTLYGFIWPIAQGWSLYDHPNPLHLTVHQAGQSASCTVRCPFGTTLSLIPSFLLPRDLQCHLPEVSEWGPFIYNYHHLN